MSRTIGIAAAQLGPIHLADTRAQVVKRLIALLEEARAGLPAGRVSGTGTDHLLPALVDR